MSELKKKIVFLTRALERGGAERQMVLLAKGLAARGWDVSVATFYCGDLDKELTQSGVLMHQLKKKGRWDVLSFTRNFIRLIRNERPAILHSYLAVSNIMSALAKIFLPQVKVVWGIRSSDMDLSRYDWLERLTSRVEKVMARWADLIVVNSQAGQRHLIKLGYPSRKIIVIHNGIDLNMFLSDAALGKRIRQEWQIQEDEILIGMIARVDPMKDHPTFLQAALSTAQQNNKLRFACVGNGHPEYVAAMKNLASAKALGSRLIWSNAREDIVAIYNALNILVSSSLTEGFSNSIAEAMACGIPCVVTDVGDSAHIVGTTGLIVSSQNPELLAAAMIKAVTQKLPEKNRMRQHIAENFSTEILFMKTEQALSQLL